MQLVTSSTLPFTHFLPLFLPFQMPSVWIQVLFRKKKKKKAGSQLCPATFYKGLQFKISNTNQINKINKKHTKRHLLLSFKPSWHQNNLCQGYKILNIPKTLIVDTGQLSPITSLCYWSQNSPVILCYESQQRPAECLHVSQTLSCQTALCGQSESQMLSCFLTLSVTNTILSHDTVSHKHPPVLRHSQSQTLSFYDTVTDTILSVTITILSYETISHNH